MCLNSNNAMKYSVLLLLAALLLGVSSCRKSGNQSQEARQEDFAAKKMLQGIWVDEDEQDVAFKAKGDTIFYPDSTSQPVYFQIIADTLVLHGANEAKYPIVRQTRNLFVFRNQNGDEVRCVLSNDPDDASFFSSKRPLPINQNQLIKRDTVIDYNGERYHCYVQVNPTTYSDKPFLQRRRSGGRQCLLRQHYQPKCVSWGTTSLRGRLQETAVYQMGANAIPARKHIERPHFRPLR